MDVSVYNPFLEATFKVLEQFGMTQLQKGNLSLKNDLLLDKNVNVLVGLTKNLQGNITYGMDEATAKGITSLMMGGLPVDDFDEMAQSAISELANMMAAGAAITLESQGLKMDISPPTLIMGENIRARVSQVKTLMVEVSTEAGILELNMGLEI